MTDSKKSPVEIEKENSRFLRGTIQEQVAQPTSHFDSSLGNLLKFHGMYQQDDRDKRQELMRQGREKAFSLMVRTKLPGGKLLASQYLKLDEFSDLYGSGNMRITTRQGIQFHGVLKGKVKNLIKSLNQALITTLGACGDIVRNVCCCPAPFEDRARMEIQTYTEKISTHLLPKTRAYHEIWLDGEKLAHPEQEEEPLYGKNYLPRKFKIAMAFPGDNCIDVYTHDLGIVPELKQGKITGFNLLIGGGMGMTHNVAETYPLLAKPLGSIKPEQLIPAIEAVIKVQRDYGNRVNRKRARLKYLLEEKGMDWFRAEAQKYAGFTFEPAKSMTWNRTHDHLGWHANGKGKFFFGLFVENGRIQDTPKEKIRSGIRELVKTLNCDVYLTLQQNILFDGIDETQKERLEGILKAHGLLKENEIPAVLRWSMACPALPTCGLAITESERALPDMVRMLAGELKRLGLDKEEITLRMTGCPNGCARPYTSEIGLVGSGVDQYAVFLGGNFEGTRLNQEVVQRMKKADVIPYLAKVLAHFKKERKSGERFGDFCFRAGIEKFKQMVSG